MLGPVLAQGLELAPVLETVLVKHCWEENCAYRQKSLPLAQVAMVWALVQVPVLEPVLVLAFCSPWAQENPCQILHPQLALP